MVLPLLSSSAVDDNHRYQKSTIIRSSRQINSSTSNGNHNNDPSGMTIPYRQRSSSFDIVIVCFVMAIIIVAMVSFWGSSMMMHHIENNSSSLQSRRSGSTTTTAMITTTSNSPIHNSLRKMQQVRVTTIEVDDLNHEGLYRKLMKSCLPYDSKTHAIIQNTKCGTYIPNYIDTATTTATTTNTVAEVTKSSSKSSIKKIQRIAILAPPGDLSGSLINRVEQMVQEYNRFVTTTITTTTVSSTTTNHHANEFIPMELIVTSHIPPYGYGKTHGYTKMIRLVPEPLLLEVTDTITALLYPGESHTIITLMDVQQVLQLILRYHCRINHMTAHTAVLSIKFMDLFADPIGISQQIRTFLFPKSVLVAMSSLSSSSQQRNNDKNTANGGGEEVEEEDKITDDDQSVEAGEGMAIDVEKSIDDDQTSLMDAELAYGGQILTYIQQQYVDHNRTNIMVGSTLLDILDQTLIHELYRTKDMSQWPCLSFWDTTTTKMMKNTEQQQQQQQQHPMSDIVQRLAKKLSPDCNDPYNHCFVKRDQCEFIGDASCSTTERKSR